MSVFTAMEEKDHEQVAFFRDSDTGLKAIVAIRHHYRPCFGWM